VNGAPVLRAPTCRFCAAPLEHTVVDLGLSPLCQTHIEPDALDAPETFHPLHARVCGQCFLVQLSHGVSPQEIFGHYAYFSSYSESWLAHGRRFSDDAIASLKLGPTSRVVEVASNDGYLLQHFAAKGVPVLGIEPAANVAQAAIERGIQTVVHFFGSALAAELRHEHGAADVLIANNVLAHVPDLNDFVAGLKALLAPAGSLFIEFPHLMQLLRHNQFDTIYHEHWSYFSLAAAERVLARHGLALVDVQALATHGGSLRLHAKHAQGGGETASARVAALRAEEAAAGLERIETYAAFGERVAACKHKLLQFLIDARQRGQQVVGYGAPGKGNTLLNYCGIRTDLLAYTVDRSPHKQGRFTPGARIPIHAPERIRQTRPDYVLILPWNLADEIRAQMAFIAEWGGRFVVPIPEVRVL
jgi:2-polyprenyl-3-methyl-5-hydroxy-6-metoxy-1,4-benzoquinol methylase